MKVKTNRECNHKTNEETNEKDIQIKRLIHLLHEQNAVNDKKRFLWSYLKTFNKPGVPVYGRFDTRLFSLGVNSST